MACRDLMELQRGTKREQEKKTKGKMTTSITKGFLAVYIRVFGF